MHIRQHSTNDKVSRMTFSSPLLTSDDFVDSRNRNAVHDSSEFTSWESEKKIFDDSLYKHEAKTERFSEFRGFSVFAHLVFSKWTQKCKSENRSSKCTSHLQLASKSWDTTPKVIPASSKSSSSQLTSSYCSEWHIRHWITHHYSLNTHLESNSYGSITVCISVSTLATTR